MPKVKPMARNMAPGGRKREDGGKLGKKKKSC